MPRDRRLDGPWIVNWPDHAFERLGKDAGRAVCIGSLFRVSALAQRDTGGKGPGVCADTWELVYAVRTDEKRSRRSSVNKVPLLLRVQEKLDPG